MQFGKNKENVANSLYCASILEEKVHTFYKILSEKIDDPLVQTLLLYIAYDSLKHSVILRRISKGIANSRVRAKDCKSSLREVWQSFEILAKEVSSVERFGNDEFSWLVSRLADIEDYLSEDYSVLVQLKTLQSMAKEIREIYGMDLENLRALFELIIRDEEGHREILIMIKDLLEQDDVVIKDYTPAIRYQNPDAWYRPPA